MVNTRNNHYNGQASNTQANKASNNSRMEQLLATQNQLMQTVI
jgi:hypothetical protein